MKNESIFKKRRLELGITQAKLAEMTGLTMPTVIRADKGETVSAATKHALGEVLGLDMAVVFPPGEDMTIGKWLRLWRHRQGLTLFEAAEAVGVSVTTLRDIEAERGFLIYTAVALADAYKISLDELIGRRVKE